MDSDLLERLRARVESLPAIDLAVAFGSVARGTQHAGSDVDLGLLLSTDAPEVWRRVEVELGRAAGRSVDLVHLAQAPPLLRFEIARDGVLLVERRPFLWSDFKARAMVDWWDWAPTARFMQAAAIARLRREVERGPA